MLPVFPGRSIEMIIEQADGHPYYSEEIAFALRDAGLLIIENGESRLAPNVQDLHDVDFPNTVQDIIIGRFDRLSARQQSILKVASVIGREFSVDTLVEIYPVEMDVAEATESLRTLVVLDLVQEVAAGSVQVSIPPRHHPGHRLRIAPLRSEESELHRAARRIARGRARRRPRCRGHHPRLPLAQQPRARSPRAAMSTRPSTIWVGRAESRFATSPTVRRSASSPTPSTWRRARASWGSSSRARRCRPGRWPGWSRTWPRPTSAWVGSIEAPTTSNGRSSSTDTRSAMASSASGPSFSPLRRCNSGIGWPGPTYRLPMASAREDLIEAATAYERLMKIYYYANDPGALITAAVSGLNLAEKAGTSPVLARIYANMSIVAGIVPLHRLARLYSRRSREVADEVDRPPEHAWVRLATSVYGVGVGDWETTEQDLRDSFDLYKRLGDSRQMEETWGTTGADADRPGPVRRGLSRSASSSRTRARAGTTHRARSGVGCSRATSLSPPGRLSNRAVQIPQRRAPARCGGRGDQCGLALRFHGRDLLATRRSGTGPRRRRLGVAGALCRTSWCRLRSRWVHRRCRRLSRPVGDRAHPRAAVAKSASELAVKKLRAFSKVFPIGRPAAHRYAGGVKARAGDDDAAAKEWEQGIEIAVHLQMPYEEGRLRLSLGRLSKDTAQLETARDLFESTGAAPFSDSARSALREI